MCEAFCSDATKDIFDPTPKAHITSLEVAHIASKLESKNVILSHIAESLNIPRENQVAEMKSEVASIYTGGIYIPMDGDVIDL